MPKIEEMAFFEMCMYHYCVLWIIQIGKMYQAKMTVTANNNTNLVFLGNATTNKIVYMFVVMPTKPRHVKILPTLNGIFVMTFCECKYILVSYIGHSYKFLWFGLQREKWHLYKFLVFLQGIWEINFLGCVKKE